MSAAKQYLWGGKVSGGKTDKGCCRSRATSTFCIFVGLIGILSLVVGVVAFFEVKRHVEKMVLEALPLTPGSEAARAWLDPPVENHLSVYAFHVTNPEDVKAGGKPRLEEKGPLVYRVQTVKDSDDTIQWSEAEGTVTYRQRKIYHFVPELSGKDYQDPENVFVTVPNIPLWTALNKLSREGGPHLVFEAVLDAAKAKPEPFVSVSFGGLLWGHETNLPCVTMPNYFTCGNGSAGTGSVDQPARPLPNSTWEPLVRPQAELVNCKCTWGLFRDRNVTLREPITLFTGAKDLGLKGSIDQYDNKKTLGWWQTNSSCDVAKGLDPGTFPPGISKTQTLNTFVDLMCMSLQLNYEKEVSHGSIRSLQFVPPANALGVSPMDGEGPETWCYCMKNLNYKCVRPGALNLEPCKRDTGAPLVLSFPHFLDADKSYSEAVDGLSPDKAKHQFYVDVEPRLGLPVALRPRFQLNLRLFPDTKTDQLRNIREDLVVPFLWAEEGFAEPSQKLSDDILRGLEAPRKWSTIAGSVLVVLGALMIVACATYFIWKWKTEENDEEEDDDDK